MTAGGTSRIYLGAAPSVGKTYAMLDQGHRRAGRCADVVVGFVETHGRVHTADQLAGLPVVPRKHLAGLPVVPRKHLEYRGASFEEMDLDAVLLRSPQLALVDELAHTNVPGSGINSKRFQDVQSLSTLACSLLRGEQALPALLDRVQETFRMRSVSLLERPDPGGRWRVLATVGPQAPRSPEDGDCSVEPLAEADRQ
jgi:hypothetical protein